MLPRVGALRAGRGRRSPGRDDRALPSGNKGSARPAAAPSHFRPRGARARAAPRCRAGQDFPLPSFGKLAPRPVTREEGRGGGRPGRARLGSERRQRLFLFRASGEGCPGPRAPPLGAPRSHLPGPRGLWTPSPCVQRARGPRPSLQTRDTRGLPEGRGLVPGDGEQPAPCTPSGAAEGGNCITVSERPGGSSPARNLGQVQG